MGARETALSALIACRRDGAWSNGVLKEYIIRDRLDARDAALAVRLCYGVLQNRGKMDFYLAQLLRGKLRDLHPVLRDILHMGLYQLLEMDRIPESAAVNESVMLAKKYCRSQKNGSAVVNGVLRNAVRSKDSLQQPVSYADRYSHPDPLISLLKASLPKGMLEPMLIADNQAPSTVVQTDLLRTTTAELIALLETEEVSAVPHRWMPDCLVLERTGNLERLKSFQSGLFYVQDPASRLSIMAAGFTAETGKILDCCAAPGGKSFAAQIACGGEAEIISCDIYEHKASLIASGAARLGLAGITAMCCDASEFHPEWEGKMDAVICDVPCSGLGIIRKKPDIRYKDLQTIAELPALQMRILENQSRYVRPGGTLLYSTCTVLKAENEQVISAFLQTHPEFEPVDLSLPDGFPGTAGSMLTLIPGQYDTDGFFMCRMRRIV